MRRRVVLLAAARNTGALAQAGRGLAGQLVLTGYASICTAADAVKLGACQYLAKPSNSDDIKAAFGHLDGSIELALTERPTSIKTLEWERIHAVLAETDFNISEAARRLGMHRRTLARKLEKQRVK